MTSVMPTAAGYGTPRNASNRLPAPLKIAIRYRRLENAITRAPATRTRRLAKRTARKSGTVTESHSAVKRRSLGATTRHETNAITTRSTAMVSHGTPYS